MINTYEYTSIAGIYTWLFENLSGKDGAPPGFFVKAGIGMAAGCCGAFVGTPAEVALIRMTSDGNLPANQRRNYKNAFEALVRIYNLGIVHEITHPDPDLTFFEHPEPFTGNFVGNL